MDEKKTGSSGLRKVLRTFVIVLVLALIGAIWWKYYYVFGYGVKSGQLNFVVHKGQLFKTYEGKLIQEGFKSPKTGSFQSNEFEFSIASRELYEQLSRNSGKRVDLHYREYNGVIPWRGNTRYVVDSIVAIHDANP
jgi:hypothetical protein